MTKLAPLGRRMPNLALAGPPAGPLTPKTPSGEPTGGWQMPTKPFSESSAGWQMPKTGVCHAPQKGRSCCSCRLPGHQNCAPGTISVFQDHTAGDGQNPAVCALGWEGRPYRVGPPNWTDAWNARGGQEVSFERSGIALFEKNQTSHFEKNQTSHFEKKNEILSLKKKQTKQNYHFEKHRKFSF